MAGPGASDPAAGSGPADVPVPHPRDSRDPWLRAAAGQAVTSPPAGQPGHGNEAVVRKQPVRMEDGCVEGGYNEVFEVICPSCGDSPDLNFSEISPRLQWLRGPHSLEVAVAVFHKHQGIPWPARP